MTTARQAAANRRNAQASTGPRSQAGRRRAAGNARRHLLTAPIPDAEVRGEVEDLVERLGIPATGLSEEARAALLDWARAEVAYERARTVERLALAHHEAHLAAPGNVSRRRAAEATALIGAFQAEGVDPDLLRGLMPADAREVHDLSLSLRYRTAAERARRRARRLFAAVRAASATDAAAQGQPGKNFETNPNSS